MNPIIVINKIDLLEDEQELKEQTAYYEAMGYPLICTSAINGTGMQELKELLKNKDSVFTGHSGTGKSAASGTGIPLQSSLRAGTAIDGGSADDIRKRFL